MPRTTQCPSCGVVLNLPDRARSGKHLKCPKCGGRFVLSAQDANSDSTLLGSAERQWAKSHHELASRPPSVEDLPVPALRGDLRETFDLPAAGDARALERGGDLPDPGIADAASLLFNDRAGPKRRETSADARAHTRRCKRCGGLVQQGMSICVSCGTDQETGLHVGLDDDLVPPPPPPPSGPPVHIAIVGGICGTVAVVALVLSLVYSVKGTGDWRNYGWLGLALVSGFGIYAAVQFVRGKSVKLLMTALTLGAVINMTALVAMPIIIANLEDGTQTVTEIDSGDNPDVTDIAITPVEAELDEHTIKVGIGLTMLYVALSWYLMSPPVRRYFHLQLRAERAIG